MAQAATRRLLLSGLGNVGRRFLELLRDRGDDLEARYGLRFLVVGAADSSGAALAPDGLPLAELVETKLRGRGAASLPGFGRPDLNAQAMVEACDADFCLEASPTNLWNGQPGLEVATRALSKGMHAILASKGALVLAFPELAELSDLRHAGRPALRFSGAVGGCLPAVNLGRRDLAGARIRCVEAILNLSSQIVLGLMAEGLDRPSAVAEAQRQGLLEADPSLDLDGWDAAAKLVILANAVLGSPARLRDVAMVGLAGLGTGEVVALRQEGRRMALLATAEAEGDGYRLAVAPTVLEPNHPFARLERDEAAILYETDIQGRMIASVARQGALGTAAALLRDVLDVATHA